MLAELLELVPAGVEELQAGPGTVEFAVYGAPGELPHLPDLNAAVGDARVEISTSELPDDWHERWKQFHKPVVIDAPIPSAGADRAVRGLRVRPPWESSHGADDHLQEVVIDPGQAFGTGGHASTRMCLELLLELAARERAAGPLMDVGTGSGVLAIAAVRLGFDPVLGLDHERESVEAARQNAVENRAEIEVRRFDLRSQALPWLGTGERPPGSVVVLANLLRPLLIELARKMPSAPGHLIAGGLLSGEIDEVAGAFARGLNLRERERRESGEWAAVWLEAC